ncbi:MAG: putative addiction module antidote protein [Desulfovibrio sp.]|jgi:probable addiction module antidote protein|nr:putative addiction module antidote protein [Desulfovibrio sp.]
MTKTAERKGRLTVSHDEAMTESLREDPAFAAGYLELAMREGSREEFLIALRRVAKAYGGIAKLAEATGLNENTLHRTLSAKGNPRLDTFVKVCGAMGMQIHITPVAELGHTP